MPLAPVRLWARVPGPSGQPAEHASGRFSEDSLRRAHRPLGAEPRRRQSDRGMAIHSSHLDMKVLPNAVYRMMRFVG